MMSTIMFIFILILIIIHTLITWFAINIIIYTNNNIK